jgi:uncharacterized protein YxjI
MHEIVKRNLFFVKEYAGETKRAIEFDVVDPETGDVILECREPELGIFTTLCRMGPANCITDFDVCFRALDGSPVLRVTRGMALLSSSIRVFDEDDEPVGGFRLRSFALRGHFYVLDADGKVLCDLKKKLIRGGYWFQSGGLEFARITRTWSGLGEGFFVWGDDYAVEISDVVEPDNPVRILILAAVVSIHVSFNG